jgi:RND superfamily putative drug exporter
MPSTHTPTHRHGTGDGRLARAVSRAADRAARHPKAFIALWLVLVVGLSFAGGITGTQYIGDSDSGTGESARADKRIAAAGLEAPAAERILLRSGDRAATAAAAADLERRLKRLPVAGEVTGPRDTPALSTAGGRTVLVQASLRGDPDEAKDHVAPVEAAVAATERAHPGVTAFEAGNGTIEKAFDDVVSEDLKRAEMISLPITLAILLLAFGAIVAASVPLLLGLTSVAAAMGALGLVSQVIPSDESAGSLVVLFGLAVGVDYSLFYIRREREERRAGKGPRAALEATAATVGRAVVVSGVTVIVALAGLLFTGLAVFTAMAIATIVVVAIAVVGSVTVLPAVLALLGDRIDKGRLPLIGRRRARTGHGVWGGLAGAVTRRPAVALVTAVAVLGALAVPAIDMHPASSGTAALPADTPVRVAERQLERAFPGAPSDAEVVVSGRGLDGTAAQQRLQALGERAMALTGGRGSIDVATAGDGRTAVVSVPMPDRGIDAAKRTVGELRERLPGEAAQIAPGAKVLVTGEAASSADFSDRLATATPLVIAFVLGLTLLLLFAAFRSLALSAAVVALNLVSVGATYGILVTVFQRDWAERVLNFTSTGTVSDWVPLFAFVILLGLSMDYTILVLERIREARRDGYSAREAAAVGVGATGGTVTSAAVVMVAVFAIFATMSFVDSKQLGVVLAAAVFLDATIVRGIALPAAVALLGDRRWRVPVRPDAGGGWDDAQAGAAGRPQAVAPASGHAS